MSTLQSRISYKGDMITLLLQVINDYSLGKYKGYSEVAIGYEDLNLILLTSQHRYFIKIFGSFRDEGECKRYIDIMQKVIEEGVAHPKLYSSPQGFLNKMQIKGAEIFLCVMEYIDGENFLQLRQRPTDEELKFIISQAARINSIDLKPYFLYDSWSVVNFLKEYHEKGAFLKSQDRKLIEPFFRVFNKLYIDELPHCFVHGDITSIDTMKDKNGNIFIVDFAVANYYPRIHELAVLLSDLFFYPNDLKKTADKYKLVIKEYQKHIGLTLTDLEEKTLPQYIRFFHAMFLLRANYEKTVNNIETIENEHFLTIGRRGLLDIK